MWLLWLLTNVALFHMWSIPFQLYCIVSPYSVVWRRLYIEREREWIWKRLNNLYKVSYAFICYILKGHCCGIFQRYISNPTFNFITLYLVMKLPGHRPLMRIAPLNDPFWHVCKKGTWVLILHEIILIWLHTMYTGGIYHQTLAPCIFEQYNLAVEQTDYDRIKSSLSLILCNNYFT